MTSKLKISEEEVGRFLLAYHRGIFPSFMKLGASFIFYYGIGNSNHIQNIDNDDIALKMIIEEYTGRLG